ncbi:MAG: GGDEF domain-containing protein [Terracidiphilus sp.]
MAGFRFIKPHLFGAIILSSAAAVASAAAPTPLTSLASIHRLTNVEASKALPVAFEATVTYFSQPRGNLFVQDGHTGIYVWGASSAKVSPGDRVLVKGVTAPSFRPYIFASEVTLLGHGNLPEPIPATFDELISGQFDSVLVTVRGIVRAANSEILPETNVVSGATLMLLTEGGYVRAVVNDGAASSLENLLDANVEVTGVAGSTFDGKRQQTGAALHVTTLADVRVLKPASSSPWSLPATPMDEILGVYHVTDRSKRIRVTGVVTYYEPGLALVLQDGAKSLWIPTSSFAPLRVGDQAEATGFPVVIDGVPELTASEFRDSGLSSPVNPRPVSTDELNSSRHIFDLVSIEGQVAISVRKSAQDEYVLVSNGHEFSADYHHPRTVSSAPLAPMKRVKVGSRIRVTGICVPDTVGPPNSNAHFNILLRSPDDIVVLSDPTWLNAHNAALLVAWLLIAVLAVGMRGWYLEHKIRRQIGSLAYVEQRRGGILEDINHSKPLAGILERITELVSVRLRGAPCWCKIADGATLGNRPPELGASLRTAEHPIAARSGPPLGSIFAAFDARTKPTAVESEALAMAAELATLAIETSRLYSDLVHRSEYDLLTDVQNRFAMENSLRAQIHAARQSAGVFGLIYIDLNEFKQVNDVYGHQAGDLYLQELTQRIKEQLRPADTLARLGGDEFAVLVSRVRSRTDVEEIAARLECCFDEPFKGEGYLLQGSASIGIALYPEDANSADSLLRAADAAMYAVKYARPGKSR